MQPLHFPSYTFKIKNSENKALIFDNFRKKYIILTPEEWVRQHVARFLTEAKKYPVSHIAIEKQLIFNRLKKRTDIVVYNKAGNPEIIVECKSPAVSIKQEIFDQIARYNLKLKAKYLMVTNGLEHYFCKIDTKNESYIFLEDIPEYQF
ncbi:MAG: restriction endonuclease subunit R [Flavobacteriaceae bacterium]|nr:MAG: restriction endonuclease subunit R [Flavobacteriaceae bacterium]